jgi:hypothetical protein
VFPAIQEAKIRRTWFKDSLGKKSMRPHLNTQANMMMHTCILAIRDRQENQGLRPGPSKKEQDPI